MASLTPLPKPYIRILKPETLVPPTLTLGPNGPFSDLGFTLTGPPKETGCHVNPRSEIVRFGLIVRVSGRGTSLIRNNPLLEPTVGPYPGSCGGPGVTTIGLIVRFGGR